MQSLKCKRFHDMHPGLHSHWGQVVDFRKITQDAGSADSPRKPDSRRRNADPHMHQPSRGTDRANRYDRVGLSRTRLDFRRKRNQAATVAAVGACAISLPTRSDICAPLLVQYSMRSRFRSRLAGVVRGL